MECGTFDVSKRHAREHLHELTTDSFSDEADVLLDTRGDKNEGSFGKNALVSGLLSNNLTTIIVID